MKRFHSPLLRVLRLRQQSERMARLKVAQARGELNAVEERVEIAKDSAAQCSAALERRLASPGVAFMIQLSQQELTAATATVHQLLDERRQAESQLKISVDAYHVAQREREVVEKAVARHRDEHRRSNARAAAVELQEWSLRPKSSSLGANRKEPIDA